ncbi:MAG: 1-deoxy-D-xylulose-5-phosphate reductoisomerase [Fimbriimonadaceae bacterium]
MNTGSLPPFPRRIAILGSTGSIGTQALRVIDRHPEKLEVRALVARSRANSLLEQLQRYPEARGALFDEHAAAQAGLPGGMAALIDIVESDDIDVVLVSVAGVIGLLPTLAAIKTGKMIALASKEVLVSGGEVVMRELRARNGTMLPIDSEHSAVFQCLLGYPHSQLSRIWLTASGGPFRQFDQAQLEQVTVEQALKHPNWSMGSKITVDSATLMNKGLEAIEARWLFDLPMDRIKMVVHPQSIVHSFVEFTDGSFLGQFGRPEMELPIQVALLYPEKAPSGLELWNPLRSPQLNFEPLRSDLFPLPGLARAAANTGGTMPCVMNAANEEAANAFVAGKIRFLDIVRIVDRAMGLHEPVEATLDNVLEADQWARETSCREM